MSAHRLLIAALLTLLLSCGWVVGQTNLLVPVNHTATGAAIGSNTSGISSFNVRLFNAKDQPGLPDGEFLQPAFWHAGTVSAGLTQALMRNSQGGILTLPLYPSVITRGGMSSQAPTWTEAAAALYAPQRFTGWHSQTNWYWQERTPLWATEPITCATTGRWEENASWNVVVGLDRIADEAASHYFERSPDGGLNWVTVANTGANVIPTHLAMTDVVIEDAEEPNKLVAVATEALNPMENGELPLITGHVKSTKVCWTNDLRDNQPRWTTFNPAPDEVLWNMQIAMNDHQIYGLACHERGDQVLYSASFAGEELVDWAVVEVNAEHPLPDGIPYDLDFGPMVGDDYTLLSTSEAGIYYSPDNGVDWYPATDFAADVIRTPGLRQMCIQIVEGDEPKIALAGWYASYVGEFDPETWEFNLQEISYDPTTLDLYQNRNRAWSGVSLPVQGGYADFALIDYSSDPYYPNDSAVVVQVDGPNMTPKNVFLGYQDHGTRPFMGLNYGNGTPWIVLNREGVEDGPTVCDLESPLSLTFVSTVVDTDPVGQTRKILEAKSCPDADYFVCSVVGSNNPTRFYYRDSGTNAWHISSSGELVPNHFAGMTPSTVYGAWQSTPGDNIHLLWSADHGENFADFGQHDPPYPYPEGEWDGNLALTSFSAGEHDGMPMYVGGYVWQNQPLNTGQIWRFDPQGRAWIRGDWENMHILFLGAHPSAPDVVWAGVKKVGSYAALLEIYVQPDRSFQWLPLWIADDPLPEEYRVADVQVASTGVLSTDIVLTVETPDVNAAGIDHTVVRRWSQRMLFAGVEVPATLSGEWTIAGEVEIPEGQTLTIESGASLLFGPGARLIVKGTLLAESAVFQQKSPDQSAPWNGIYVEGTCELSYCTIEEAVTGVKSVKEAELVLANCTIQNNEIGLDLYAPPGTTKPLIDGCTIIDNVQSGIVLTGSECAGIFRSQIHGNGEDGILMIDSYAQLSENQIRDNGRYGLECFGSSPILYCN
ncbi:MAG: right-handed parallel beta-helix repeat-containing protein, partial [bacterium]|nr:right-handed parallel beta-helix repeat-containing protein [bacterium]